MPLDYSDYRDRKVERLSMSESITYEQCQMVYNYQEISFFRNLANNPSTDVRILEKLYFRLNRSVYEEYSIFAQLLLNPSLPRHLIQKAISIPSYRINSDVALNPQLDDAMVKALRKKKGEQIYINLCSNSHLPPTILRELYKEYKLTQNSYANLFIKNTSTPEDILLQIIEDNDYPPSSSEDLLTKSSLTPAIVNRLIKKYSLEKIVKIVENPSAPTFALELIYNSYLKSRDITKENSPLWNSLIRNKNTSPAILEEVFNKKSGTYGHNFFASNPSTPIHILEGLITSNNSIVPAVLANNPSITKEMRLAIDWTTIFRGSMRMFLDSDYATAEKVKETLILLGQTNRIELVESLIESPLAEVEDILNVLRVTNIFKSRHVGYLLDREEQLYPRFVKFMKTEYEVDITCMPDSLILQLLDIHVE
jgi:hypothetical protein